MKRLAKADTITLAKIIEKEASVMRRRFQRGWFEPCDGKGWTIRWREHVKKNGQRQSVKRSRTLKKSEYPTKRSASKILEEYVGAAGSSRLAVSTVVTFDSFAADWQEEVLSQYKPSMQSSAKSVIRCHLLPFLRGVRLKDIHGDSVQRFIASRQVSPKTVLNAVGLLRLMWKYAKAQRLVRHNPFDGTVLPKWRKREQFALSQKQMRRIITAAQEPYQTTFWLVGETGIRAGELCGLRVEDADLERGLILVRQSVWHGKVQTPKTKDSVRTFALSPILVEHLHDEYLPNQWRPNSHNLLFPTRRGTPRDAGNLVKDVLHPILDSLKIPRCGLKAFRHGNGSMMDRLGAPVKVRQGRLGHADVRTTLETYTHLSSEDDCKVAAQIGQLLAPVGRLKDGTIESRAD